MNKVKCGIVILNYNSYNLTVNLVNKIINFQAIDSICVVDNNSEDNFENVFQNSKVHYIKNSKNLGYSAGNNIGIKYLIEKDLCNIIFIANPDTIFENDVIEKMKFTLKENNNIALISCSRTGNNGAQIHQYFDFPNIKNSIKNCFYLTRKKFEEDRRKKQNEIVKNENEMIFVDAVPGSLFGMSKDFILENNYLYEGIFLYGEEIVVGRQAKELGYKVVLVTSVTYVHDHIQKRFSNLSMFKNDKKSLKKYFIMFEDLKWYEKMGLDIAIFLGTIEYSCAYFLYHLLKK